MELRAVLRKRRMVRAFRRDPVPPAALGRILDAARKAPSAGHTQGFAFLVLDDRADVERFWTASLPGDRTRFPWPGLLDAPVIVLPCGSEAAYRARYAEPDKAAAATGPVDESFWTVPFWHVDTAFATMTILLTAVDEGLGALFFGLFPPGRDAVRGAFGIPKEFEPLGAVALGYADTARDRLSSSVGRGRKPAEHVIRRGRWDA